MNALRPFFPYFGSKWRLAPRYPAPKHSLVIEPFAGSAGSLIGFWANRGSSQPKPTMQKWGDQHELRVSSWGALARERIASQLDRIRRWSVRLGAFDLEPDHRATWFIDPPYVEQGFRYRKHAIDFAALASWCKRRRGQVIVCEGPGPAASLSPVGDVPIASTSGDLPQGATCGKSHRGDLAANFVFGSLDTEALTSGTAVSQETASTSITPPEFEGGS